MKNPIQIINECAKIGEPTFTIRAKDRASIVAAINKQKKLIFFITFFIPTPSSIILKRSFLEVSIHRTINLYCPKESVPPQFCRFVRAHTNGT